MLIGAPGSSDRCPSSPLCVRHPATNVGATEYGHWTCHRTGTSRLQTGESLLFDSDAGECREAAGGFPWLSVYRSGIASVLVVTSRHGASDRLLHA